MAVLSVLVSPAVVGKVTEVIVGVVIIPFHAVSAEVIVVDAGMAITALFALLAVMMICGKIPVPAAIRVLTLSVGLRAQL